MGSEGEGRTLGAELPSSDDGGVEVPDLLGPHGDDHGARRLAHLLHHRVARRGGLRWGLGMGRVCEMVKHQRWFWVEASEMP